MKQLCLTVCGLVVICACGGGGGGTPAPPALYVVISPSTQTNIDPEQTVKFTATVANDSSAKGVTWSVSAAGVTGSACGGFTNSTTAAATYNAPASALANLNVTVTATSVADPTIASSAVVMVAPAPSITAATLTDATPNANYSTTLQATGGVGTYTWSLASGGLPTGLSLSSSGTISGVATVSGAFTFTVQVADSSAAPGGPATAQAQFALTVVTVVTITTTALPAGSAGVSYLAGIDASGGTPPYTWSVTAGSLPAGLTMQPSSGVISGTPTTQGSATFTVAAQDSSPTKQTQSAPLTVAIGAPGPLVITTFSLLNGALNSPYSATLAAVGGTPPYTWSVIAGGLPRGVALNSSTGAISGTPTSAGTATFTVMVADASSPHETQTQGLSLTVGNAAEACASSGNNAVLSGQYAFSLSGFNAVGFVTVVGSFTADGAGKITAGEADTNGVLGAQHGTINGAASSYSVGSDNRGCATLATSFGAFAVHFALGSVAANVAAGGRLIEWDNPSTSAYVATGQLLRQSSSAFAGGLNGSYTFRTVGWDPTTLTGREACAGVIGATGNTFYAMEQDCNDGATVTNTAAPDAAGTFTTLDANGRGTGIIAVGQSNATATFYAVSSSQLLEVNADADPFAGGEWDQQSVPSGGAGFTQAAMNGNMVFYLSGLSLDGTASDTSMETATADGASSLSMLFYEDRAGTMQVSTTLTCTYAVQPNGRVTLSSTTDGCGGTPPVFYLTSLNTGFIVDASPGVDTGTLEPQSAGPFNNAALSGSFFGGTVEVALQSVPAEVDAVALNGTGTINGTGDLSSPSTQNAGASFPANTYAVNSDGTFSVSSSNGAVAGVMISNTKFVMFSPTTSATSYPTLVVMQH